VEGFMNQEKIGKFISKSRKEKKLTQQDLAEKLGVSNKAISKWERGICMPDISMFKPLCKELDISINDLLNGEKDVKTNVDENIIKTIDLSKEKHKNDLTGYIILKILGIILIITGWSMNDVKYFFPTLFILTGLIFVLISFFKISNCYNKISKIVVNILYTLVLIGSTLFIDYLFILDEVKPRFYIYSKKEDNYEYYKTLNKSIYYCNINSDDKYYLIYPLNEKKTKEYEKLEIEYCIRN